MVSMISHLIDELKRHAQAYETGEQEGSVTAVSTAKILREAVWTIEQQSLKIQANNQEDGWVPVVAGLPDKGERVIVTVIDRRTGASIMSDGYYKNKINEWCYVSNYPKTFTTFESTGYRVIAWRRYPMPYGTRKEKEKW